MKIFGLAGWSGSGKTGLIIRLLPIFVDWGLTVSTIKHAHHHFDIDKPGKDSFRHREAGAQEVLISSASRWAMMHEIRDGREAGLDELIARMSPVDLLLVEGFKRERLPKLEVHRPVLGQPMLQPGDPDIVAVASDTAIAGLDVPCLDLDDTAAIARFILTHCGLEDVAA